MFKRVKRSKLEPGMFLVKYGQGTKESPVVYLERPVLTLDAIDAIVPAWVPEVVIDDALTIAVINSTYRREKAVAPDKIKRPVVPLAEELPVAQKLYEEAVEHAHCFMEEVRRGKEIDCREAFPIVDGFIGSVFRNESAAAMLFHLKEYDAYTYTHSINVGVLAIILGKYLELGKDNLRMLGMAGLFHDVGKARIPEEILNKPAKLNPREHQVIKTHPIEGYRIIEAQAGLDPNVMRGVIEHHERYDGTGYPRGLSGGEIGLFGRVLSIVDVYDALTSKRAYKNAMPAFNALGMMYQWRDTTFCPTGVEHFIKCIGVYPNGSFVKLSNGCHAITIDNSGENAARPKVRILFDAAMRPVPKTEIDLAKEDVDHGLHIIECLDPADYRMDLTRVLEPDKTAPEIVSA